MHLDGTKERRGSSGRVPDALAADHVYSQNCNITMPQDLRDRLDKYCQDEERARSWCVQKAVDAWLKSKGY